MGDIHDILINLIASALWASGGYLISQGIAKIKKTQNYPEIDLNPLLIDLKALFPLPGLEPNYNMEVSMRIFSTKN